MSNMLSDGMAFLAEQLQSSCGDPVTYQGSGWDFTATATRGNSTFDATDTNGNMTQIESRDFIFPASVFTDYELPDSGDRINDAVHIYEVLSLPGQLPYKFCDAARTLIRVHTKLIEN